MARANLRLKAFIVLASSTSLAAPLLAQSPAEPFGGTGSETRPAAVLANFRRVPAQQAPAVGQTTPNPSGPSTTPPTAGKANELGAQNPQGGALTPLDTESVYAPISAANIMVDQIGTKVIPEDSAGRHESKVVSLPNGEDRGFGCRTFRWQAANNYYWPLYFEEPMLERHGQTRVPECIQPAVSGAKFLGNLTMLPYKATLQRPLEDRYALGHFRPGSPAPCLRETLPWSTHAALVQGGAATAVFVGLPW